MHSQIELHGAMREAIRLGEYVDCDEYIFCRSMADVYGCIPLRTDGDNLYRFLQTLYHYGKVQGVRQERARKRRRQKVNHEVEEIAWELAGNTLLYQVMKTAKELNSVEPRIEAANFLKGAKKNED